MLAGCSAVAPPQEENALIAQGKRLYYQGRYDPAEALFQDALVKAAGEGDRILEAQSRKWLGNILLATARDDEALAQMTAARVLLDSVVAERRRLKAPVPAIALDERHNLLNNIAIAYKNQGRYDDAAAVHREVLNYDAERGESLPLAVSLSNLGVVYHLRADLARKQGRDSLYHSMLDSARAYFRMSLSTAQTADAWVNLGNVHAFENRRDSAVAAFGKADEIYRRDGYKVQEALCRGNIGILLERDGNLEEAAAALKRAIAIIEELRGGLASIDVRSGFISGKYHLYERLVSILVQLGRPAEAFEYVERAKARSFLDLIGSRSIGDNKKRTAAGERLVGEERLLNQRISELMDMPDSGAVAAALIVRHRAVLDSLRAVDPEYAAVKSIDPVPVSSLQALLDDSTAIIEYFIGETVENERLSAFVFVLRRDTVVARPLGIRPDFGLDRKVEALRKMLYSDFPNAKTAALRIARMQKGLSPAEASAEWLATRVEAPWQYALVEMYSVFLFPAETALRGVKRAWIVPHGPLHHLPFQALIKPAGIDRRTDSHVPRPRYLIEDMVIAYLPSAGVLPFARGKKPVGDGSGLVVGDPAYADPVYRKRPLEGALIEADSVAKFIARPVLLKRDAAEERAVKESMRNVEIVNLATHGELNRREPMLSRILFASARPEGSDDGDLTVAEVFNLDLRASMVALSACQTAQVSAGERRSGSGDELVGLTRSFFYAGTPSVAASLWYVDDDATLAWMTSFYRAWREKGMAKADAGRAAAMSMLDNPADPDWIVPYYWSAFILFGDLE